MSRVDEIRQRMAGASESSAADNQYDSVYKSAQAVLAEPQSAQEPVKTEPQYVAVPIGPRVEPKPVANARMKRLRTDLMEAEIAGGFLKQQFGALSKGTMRLGRAVLKMPEKFAEFAVVPAQWVMAEEILATDDPEQRQLYLRSLKKTEKAMGKVVKATGYVAAEHKRGMDSIIAAHPEWESEPPENFIDLLTSPGKLLLAVEESAPVLISAGILTAAGKPSLAVAMMYAAEGQEAEDLALADGGTKQQANQAYHIYGSVASILEYLQLQGIMKVAKGTFKSVLNRTVQKIVRGGWKTITKEIVKVAGQEAIEEMAQGAWQETTAKLVYGKEFEGDFIDFVDRRLQEGLIGAVMGIVPGMSGGAMASARKTFTAKVAQETGVPQNRVEKITDESLKEINETLPPQEKHAQFVAAWSEKMSKETPVEGVKQDTQLKKAKSAKPADLAIGQQYGLSTEETQSRLAKAEDRYRQLKNKPIDERLTAEKKELAFLRRNRTNVEALLSEETKPLEPKKMSKKAVLALGHMIPKQLGMSEATRRELNKKITGQSSMKNMTPAQREQVVAKLKQMATAKNIDVEGPENSPLAQALRKFEERKQKPRLGARARRDMKKLRKAWYSTKRGLSHYFLNMSRVQRMTSELDNHENDGVFTTEIYNPVKDADTNAHINRDKELESFRDVMDKEGIDVAKMMSEVKDIGADSKLTTSQRIGIYNQVKNKGTRAHALSEFSPAELTKIIQSVEQSAEEMFVADYVLGWSDHNVDEVERVYEETEGKKFKREEFYMAAFVVDKSDLDTPSFIQSLISNHTARAEVGGKQRTIERKHGAAREIEHDIFIIFAKQVAQVERYKAMAPVAKKVGSLINNKKFKAALNDVTYGHGSKVMNKWLEDAIRGRAAFDTGPMAQMLRYMRMSGIRFALGFKILTAAKQGLSLFPAAGIHPMMIPLLTANLSKAAYPGQYRKMQEFAYAKSGVAATRDWNRDLRTTFNKRSVKRYFKGKSLSPMAMRMATYIDRHTVVTVWTSAYQLALRHEMSDVDAVRFADGVIEKTQPMANAVDLPGYFRGGEFEKNLTVFQNMINQNFNILRYDIIGELGAGKISPTMAGYRFLMSYTVPAMLLGMISRGRPPEDLTEALKDQVSYMLSPFLFFGPALNRMLTGAWGGDLIYGVPMQEIERAVTDPSIKQIVKGVGAVSHGYGPSAQMITTAEGAYNLMTEKTDDFRELIWSKYALKDKKNLKKRIRKF